MTKKLNYVEKNMEVIKQILNNGFGEEDLIRLNNYTISRIKALRALRSVDLKATLKVGQIVEWSGRKGYHKGSIVKINRTRVQVKDDMSFGIWNVPMTMVKIVK